MCLEKFCEKCCEMHKNPANCLLHLIAGIVVIVALWYNSIEWILVGILIDIIGQIIQAATKRKVVEKPKKKKR